RQRTDCRAGAGAAADDQQLLLPRSLIRVRRLLPSLHDPWRTAQFVARHAVPELHGVEPLLVADVDRVRPAADALLRDEELSLLTVRERDRHQRAFERTVIGR